MPIYVLPEPMDMPVQCAACSRPVELNDTRSCDAHDDLRCPACYDDWQASQDDDSKED